MTTEILSTEKEQEIDWSTPQWVESESGIIVSTNGTHSINCFEGTKLPCNGIGLCEFATDWIKESFKPIPKEGLVIRIKN